MSTDSYERNEFVSTVGKFSKYYSQIKPGIQRTEPRIFFAFECVVTEFWMKRVFQKNFKRQLHGSSRCLRKFFKSLNEFFLCAYLHENDGYFVTASGVLRFRKWASRSWPFLNSNQPGAPTDAIAARISAWVFRSNHSSSMPTFNLRSRTNCAR